jgi:GntR family transcriptional repressor for pyruvate dehydrogenase complex
MRSDQKVGAEPFEAIPRERRLSDKVADALTESILANRFPVGQRLPSERALSEQFGVSRPIVREAVRSLIAKRLLADHPRRGHVVAAVEPESVRESLTLFVRGRQLDYAHISEVRSVLEVETAGLAAERATDEQLDELRVAADGIVPGLGAAEASVIDVEFHRGIALVTGNEFFVVLIDSMRDVLLEIQLPTLADPEIVEIVRGAHRDIFEAIAAHDADRARAAMRAHLATAERQMRTLVAASGGAVAVR